MVERPGAVRTMSAAALAASVAPATAIPTLARLSAGASLTPSPVMPTRCPRSCRLSTIRYLCSGKTEANPLTSSTTSPREPLARRRASPSRDQISAPMMFVPFDVPQKRKCQFPLPRRAAAGWRPHHVEPRARLDRDRPRVPRDHLHLHAFLLGLEDLRGVGSVSPRTQGALFLSLSLRQTPAGISPGKSSPVCVTHRRRRVVPRRVQQRDEAQQLPHLPGGSSGVAGDVHEPGDPEAAEAALGVRQDAVLRRRADLRGVGGQRHHHVGRPLGVHVAAAFGVDARRLGALVDGVERDELVHPPGLELREAAAVGLRERVEGPRHGLRRQVVDGQSRPAH